MQESDLVDLSTKILIAAGADSPEAEVVARILVWCDSVGRPSQGVWRLPILARRLQKGLYQSPCKIDYKMTAASLGTVDANNGLAHYVAHQTTLHAIQIARKEGICAITIKNSNYFGAGGYYANHIAKSGMIGIVLSNSFPKVIPYGGQRPALGTNPFSFACPALNEEPLLIDMATSELAGSTVRMAQEKNRESSSPHLSFSDAKGYSLSLFVEILAGVLSGAGISHEVKSLYNNFDEGGNSGHFILAINIEKFLPLEMFQSRMQGLIKFLRASGDSTSGVQYPGENRWLALKTSREKGIILEASTQQALNQLADELGVCTNLQALRDMDQ